MQPYFKLIRTYPISSMYVENRNQRVEEEIETKEWKKR